VVNVDEFWGLIGTARAGVADPSNPDLVTQMAITRQRDDTALKVT
jgi:hypothetical protein